MQNVDPKFLTTGDFNSRVITGGPSGGAWGMNLVKEPHCEPGKILIKREWILKIQYLKSNQKLSNPNQNKSRKIMNRKKTTENNQTPIIPHKL